MWSGAQEGFNGCTELLAVGVGVLVTEARNFLPNGHSSRQPCLTTDHATLKMCDREAARPFNRPPSEADPSFPSELAQRHGQRSHKVKFGEASPSPHSIEGSSAVENRLHGNVAANSPQARLAPECDGILKRLI